MSNSSNHSTDDPQRASWTTPRASKKYQQIQAELVGLGHSGADWDALAFSLGLLPNLFAHGRALQRVAELFATPVFLSAATWTKQAWVQKLPAWRRMLTDWEKVRRSLPRSDSFLDPRRAFDFNNPRKHPLRMFGIDTAPLVSVLMVRHEYSASEDPARLALAARFDHLQAMLTAAAIDFTWASSASVDAYLDWQPDSRHSFSAFPVEPHRACRTVRWLSEAPQAPLLETLGQSADPREFVLEMRKWKLDVTPAAPDAAAPQVASPKDVQHRAYPVALSSYLDHWPEILDGVALVDRPVKTGGGGGSGGGGTAVEGFVPPDNVAAPGQQPDSSPSPGGKAPLGNAAPGGGIANEDVAPIRLPLVSVGQIDALTSAQKWRAMRAAMGDTVTPHDIRYLQATDAHRIALHAFAHAEAALAQPVDDRQRAEDALLALLTLALAQPPAVLSKTGLAIIQPTTSDADAAQLRWWNDAPALSLQDALELQIEAPVLLAWPELHPTDEPPWLLDGFDRAISAAEHIDGQHPRPAPGEAVAFLLPAIEPTLAGAESDAIGGPGRPRQTVRNLLIPAGPTGNLLLRLHRNGRPRPWFNRQPETRPASTAAFETSTDRDHPQIAPVPLFRSFDDPTRAEAAEGASADVAERRMADFLNGADGCAPPPGHERWSVRLLQDLMPAHVEASTGDRTLAWLLSCDPTGSNQARLYYTQHTLARLGQAWLQAVHAAGLGVLAPETNPSTNADNNTGSGEGPATEQPADPHEGVPPLPATWPWRTVAVETSRVGARFVASVEDVRRLVRTLQAKLKEPVALERRSALRNHHRHLLLLTIVYQGLCTAMRALRSPVTLMRAVEQSDRVRAKAGLSPVDHVFVGLADKESFYNQRARLVALPAILVQQLRILQSHQITLVARLDRYDQWQSAPARVRAMFRLDDNDVPAEISVAWVEKELAELGFDWPANFARAFIRTHLLTRGCAAADLDALLGHRDAGGGAIGLHATLDFDSSLRRLQAALAQLHADIGLKLVPSALVVDRIPSSSEVLLAPMHQAGPVGRGRSDRPRQQGREERLPDFWKAIHQRATDDDRRQVALLYRLLRTWARQGNLLAQLLCAPEPADFAAAHGLLNSSGQERPETADDAAGATEAANLLAPGAEDITRRLTLQAENNSRARFHMASSWFRLLVRARNMLGNRGIDVPEFPVVPSVRPPSSPFVESSLLVIPIVDGWRAALLTWMDKAMSQVRHWRASKDDRDDVAMPMPAAPSEMAAEGWATSLVMSAVLNGMLLDLTQVGMLLRRFSTPGGRDLPLSGPFHRAHLDFHVAAGGAMDRQTHRWWFDPLSELIWLTAPPMPRALRLGDLHPWLRRLALEAFQGSVAMPFEPHSFSDLIRCAEVWWLTRASRTVVASQRRQIDASSILTDRWSRLVGAKRLAAPGCHDRPASADVPEDASQPETSSRGDGKRRRRRAAVASTESAFSRLALVRTAGERGLDQSTVWEPAPGDAELLATLAVAHPWIEQVARALMALAQTPQPWDLSGLRQVERPTSAVQIDMLIEFAAWLADPAGGGFTGPPLVRTFTAAAQALALNGELRTDGSVLQVDVLARMLREVDDLPLSAGATPRSVRLALHKLAQFMRMEAEVLALLDADDREELKGDDQRSHADACVISFEEYAQVQHALDQGLYSGLTRGYRNLGRLLLTLCFRLGLRPGESYGLRLRDVEPDAVYVLPYGDHQLKSSNARRRVPLKPFMSEDERQRLQRFVRMHFDRGASPDDLLLAQPNEGPANRQRLDSWVHRVMRDVTLDPGVRLYHARHSLSTWSDLALRAVDHPELLRFFEELPETSAYLQQGELLAKSLFGSTQAALGRTSFALARLVGHVGPAVTHMHYIHGDDLVRAAVVEREAGRLDKTVWIQLTGLAKSTTYALLQGGGFHGLMDHARRAAGWRALEIDLVGAKAAGRLGGGVDRPVATPTADSNASGGNAGDAPNAAAAGAMHLSEWIAVSRVCEISAIVATGKRTAEQAAALFGLDPQRIEALMGSLQRLLPEVAQPGKRATDEAAKGLVSLALSSETSISIQRAETAVRGRSQQDPVGLRSELEFLISCYDRRDRDFHVRDADSLRRLVRVASVLGIQPSSTHLLARALDPVKDAPKLPSWAQTEDLGPFATCQIRSTGVRSAAKADSYSKWLGLMPVTSAQEGCGNAFATFGALSVAILDSIAGI